jgi:excisionase family DNA binding protein
MPATPADRLTCTVEEAAALLGISRAKAYQCVREGQLRSVHIGRRILVPKDAITELLSGNSGAPSRGTDRMPLVRPSTHRSRAGLVR